MASSTEELGITIVRTLVERGFIAYFAGGWVRDRLLLSRHHALPLKEIFLHLPPLLKLTLPLMPPLRLSLRSFEKTVPVGIAFGVIIVLIEGVPFEVSTFRRDREYQDGRHPTGVIFSSPKEDALRRDFTINGMFYDPINHQLYDFVGGERDLEKGVVRAIGNAAERFQEDRLRMLRAVRFAARFAFSIERETERAIKECAQQLLPAVSMERIWQELTKMAQSPRFDMALINLYRLGLLVVIFPS